MSSVDHLSQPFPVIDTPTHTRAVTVDELRVGDVVYRSRDEATVEVLGVLADIDRGGDGSAALLVESGAVRVHHRAVLVTRHDRLRTSRCV